jgi:hypothetical protein
MPPQIAMAQRRKTAREPQFLHPQNREGSFYMARPRTPTNVLELRGAFNKNPQRKRPNEPKATGEIGSFALGSCDPAEIWNELVGSCPQNVLTNADRMALEIAVEYLRQFRTDPMRCSSERVKTLIGLLARFGMTPSDRAKLSLPGNDKKEESPWAKFATQ